MWGWVIARVLGQDAITFEANTVVAEGSEAVVTFRSRVEGRLRVELQCGGRRYGLDTGVSPGSSHPLPLGGLGKGEQSCNGQVRLDEPDGAWAEMPLGFRVVVQPSLDWTFGPDDVDLAAKTLVVHPSRPLKEGTLELIGLGGASLQRVSADLSDPARPSFRWDTPDEVLKLRVEGADTSGFLGFLELSPWSYAVPHDDVIFPSGSHEILAAEVPKLERCWSEVQAVLDKYGDVVQISLFVAGYTDTVGDAAGNVGLSERRARAIASWFRQRGFPGRIRYQGFGETVLAVGTPDETDMPANRRALYLLAADTPPVSEQLPRQAWTAL